jgi:LCP family protein required for cell wall assembly
MTDTPRGTNPGGPAHLTDADPAAGADPPVKRPRRGKRIAVLSGLGILVLFGAAVAAGFLAVNHLVSRVPRISVGQLPASGGGQTILITGAGFGATGGPSPASAAEFSGLIMLMHVNASQKAGAVVSIPPMVVVPVPGKGDTELENALAAGGPTLLVRAVEQLTHVPINHYARIDFDHVSQVINALGGVDVTMLKPGASIGYKFHAGVNELNGVTAIYYVRDRSVSNADRILRQQNLMRAILSKVASRHLLTTPVKMYRVLDAVTSMLTVSSNFTNSELMSLVKELSSLDGKAGTFVTAPSHQAGKKVLLDRPASGQLWRAITDDSVAAFARQDPQTVTPVAVP